MLALIVLTLHLAVHGVNGFGHAHLTPMKREALASRQFVESGF